VLKITKEEEGDIPSTIAGTLDFMYYFRTNCTKSLLDLQDNECARRYMNLMGIDVDNVQKCFEESFEIAG